MSFLGDALDFEKFQLSDWWKKIKDQPESLLLGMDPISTGFWNALGVGGGNQEPLVNVLGGPMGGGASGLQNTGGIYDRAGEKGINTMPAIGMHDAAEMIALMYLGNYGLDKLGGATGGQTGQTGQNASKLQNIPKQNPLQSGGKQRDNRLDLLRLLVMMQEQTERRNASIGRLPVTGGVR